MTISLHNNCLNQNSPINSKEKNYETITHFVQIPSKICVGGVGSCSAGQRGMGWRSNPQDCFCPAANCQLPVLGQNSVCANSGQSSPCAGARNLSNRS